MVWRCQSFAPLADLSTQPAHRPIAPPCPPTHCPSLSTTPPHQRPAGFHGIELALLLLSEFVADGRTYVSKQRRAEQVADDIAAQVRRVGGVPRSALSSHQVLHTELAGLASILQSSPSSCASSMTLNCQLLGEVAGVGTHGLHSGSRSPGLFHLAIPAQCQLLVEVIDAELEEELQDGAPASRLSLTQVGGQALRATHAQHDVCTSAYMCALSLAACCLSKKARGRPHPCTLCLPLCCPAAVPL